MPITRKSLAETFEAQDLVTEAANRVKRDAMIAYRAQLIADGWQKDDVKAEAEAFRKAFARMRAVTKHGETEVLETTGERNGEHAVHQPNLGDNLGSNRQHIAGIGDNQCVGPELNSRASRFGIGHSVPLNELNRHLAGVASLQSRGFAA